MDKDERLKYICTKYVSIVEAMQQIDNNSGKALYVVDEKDRLIGSVSDGDIRRWIIKTGNLSACVEDVMFPKPRFVFEDDHVNHNHFMTEFALSSIPVVDKKRRIVKIVFDTGVTKAKKYSDNRLAETKLIIMAGGKGTRLYPYTKILPKPLIPIGDVPILERIIDKFFQNGIKEIFLTLNYKKEMIKSYFADLNLPYNLYYIEEPEPLGTAGSIRLIHQKIDKPFIVTNCDVLIQAKYGDIYHYHEIYGNDMTIVSSLKNTSIPYGVLHSGERGIVTSIEEKPKLSYFINTGMYIVNPEYLDWIPEGRVFHMTELAEMMIRKGKKVGMYPISENSFLDMGELEEMKKMEERVENW